jgi:hypothetical protein
MHLSNVLEEALQLQLRISAISTSVSTVIPPYLLSRCCKSVTFMYSAQIRKYTQCPPTQPHPHHNLHYHSLIRSPPAHTLSYLPSKSTTLTQILSLPPLSGSRFRPGPENRWSNLVLGNSCSQRSTPLRPVAAAAPNARQGSQPTS